MSSMEMIEVDFLEGTYVDKIEIEFTTHIQEFVLFINRSFKLLYTSRSYVKL